MQGRKPAEAGSLFNLRDDIGETTDVSAQHPEKVEQLAKIMEQFMKDLEANARDIGKTKDWTPENSQRPKKKKKR